MLRTPPREVKKITHLYPWQAECLALEGVSQHRADLVYCAPTSGGKSLVAEVLLVKRLIAGMGNDIGLGPGLCRGRGGGCGDAGSSKGALGLVILPFVTLCNERADELTRMLKPLSIEVRRFFGGQGGKLPPIGGSGGLLIATPEKANDVVTKLIEEERIRELVVVVVDELHMVQDPSRGGTLELLLTKLLFAAGKASHLAGGDKGAGGENGAGGGGGRGSAAGSPASAAADVGPSVPLHDHLVPLSAGSGGSGLSQLSYGPLPLQIVGMSATLPNVDCLARWLNDAQLFETDYRPVELSVFVKKGRDVLAVTAPAPEPDPDSDDPERASGSTPRRGSVSVPSLLALDRELIDGGDKEHVVQLVKETMETKDGGVIVFCAAKYQCEIVAAALSKHLPDGIAMGGAAVVASGEAAAAAAQGAGGGADGVLAADGQPRVATLAELAEQLRRLKTWGSDTDSAKGLASCVAKGIAWHNAGLHQEEKAIVELAFRSGSTPYTLHPTPYTLHPTPYTLHPTPYTLHPTPYTLHPTPYTLHPTPYTLHPTPYILHPTPYTQHPTPYTLHPNT